MGLNTMLGLGLPNYSPTVNHIPANLTRKKSIVKQRVENAIDINVF